MRMTRSLAIATAALLATSPAVAQNTATPANTTDSIAANSMAANTTDMNTAGATTTTMATNTTDTTQAAPGPGTDYVAPEKKRGFPWGILGLLGLIGLIPRNRRS